MCGMYKKKTILGIGIILEVISVNWESKPGESNKSQTGISEQTDEILTSGLENARIVASSSTV